MENVLLPLRAAGAMSRSDMDERAAESISWTIRGNEEAAVSRARARARAARARARARAFPEDSDSVLLWRVRWRTSRKSSSLTSLWQSGRIFHEQVSVF